MSAILDVENMFKLSNRLKACADLVPQGAKVVDVGADHAYLPIYLVLNEKISFAIACDANIGPLAISEKNIKNHKLESMITTVLSDGLKNINEKEVDTVVIAGMGGELIVKILSDCTWANKTEKKIILNPMTSESDLRIYLTENLYEIEKETAVLCGRKIYSVMLVKYTGEKQAFDEIYPYVGRLLGNKNENTLIYIGKQIRNLKNRLMGAKIRGQKEEMELLTRLIYKLRRAVE